MEHPVIINSNRTICDNIVQRNLSKYLSDAIKMIFEQDLRPTSLIMNEADWNDIVKWESK